MGVSGGKRLHFVADLDTKPLAAGAAKSKGIIAGMGRSFKSLRPFSSLALGAAGVGLAATAMFTKITKDAYQFSKDYETAMLEVKTISASVREDFEGMSDEIINLSAISPEGAVELTKGLYQIVSAGYDGAKAMDILTVATKTATAAVTDTFTVADVLTTIMNAYGDAAGDAMSISDRLFTVVKNGKVTMGELAKDLSTVAGLASQAGVDLNDLFAAYSTGTKTLQSDIFTTGIKGLLTSIIQGPTDDAKEIIKELGIQFDITSLQTKGLVVFLQDLIEATNGDIEVISALIPNVRGLTGLLSLATDNGKEFEKQLGNIETGVGSMITAYEIMLASAENQWSIVHNKWNRELKSLGESAKIASLGIAEMLSALMTQPGDIKWLTNVTEGIKSMPLVSGIKDRIEALKAMGRSASKAYADAIVLSDSAVERMLYKFKQESLKGLPGDDVLNEILGIENAEERLIKLQDYLKKVKGDIDIDIDFVMRDEAQSDIRAQAWDNITGSIQSSISETEKYIKLQAELSEAERKRIEAAAKAAAAPVFKKDLEGKLSDLKEKLGTGTAEYEIEIKLKILDIENEINKFDQEVQRELEIRTRSINLEVIPTIKAKTVIGNQTKDTTKQVLEVDKLLKKKVLITKEEQKQLDISEKKGKQDAKLSDTADKMVEGLSDASEILGAMSYAASQFDAELGKSLGTMADIAMNAANLIDNIGNPVGMISSGIGIVGNIASLFNKDDEDSEFASGLGVSLSRINKNLELQGRILGNLVGSNYFFELERQANSYYDLIKTKTDIIKENLKESFPDDDYGYREEDYDREYERIKLFNDEIDALSIDDIIDRYVSGTLYLSDAAKLWIGDILEARSNLNNLYAELTSFTGKSIADNIVSGLEEGKRGIADFADTFEEMMEQALINSLKISTLQPLMDGWNKQLYEFMNDDDGLTEEEINTLRERWNNILELWDTSVTNAERATGLNLGSTDEEIVDEAGLSGAIRGITEETAGLIAGQFTAMRVDLLDMNNNFADQTVLFDEMLVVQERIADNTDQLSRLEAIEKAVVNSETILESRL